MAQVVRAACRRWWGWGVARPQLCLAVAAILAVVLSCYPVIFLGKSFVSPAVNSITLMYDANPTLPGTGKLKIEDLHGADAGAMMWEFVPYGVMQHDAIFKDHELPLWNRYAGCGVPLLGQGLSMIEDPLHWVVILGDSAAWSWDGKFLAARFLFCFGVGLLALAATRHLGSALCLAVSAAFIGFFFFRFNHPAIFGLCYSPWIPLALLRLARASSFRGRSLWALGLVLANTCVLNSGTVKEAFMLGLIMNAAGVTAVFFEGRKARPLLPIVAAIAAAWVLTLAINVPVLFTFARELPRSFTFSNEATCQQYSPATLVNFFDDIFWRYTMPDIAALPSVNFFVLLGVIWAAVQGRRVCREPVFASFAGWAVGVGGLAFGLVPPAMVLAVPVLRNIGHVGGTFATVMIPLVLVVAGFGFRELLAADGAAFRRRIWAVPAAVLGLVCLHLAFHYHLERGGAALFAGYTVVIVGAVSILPWVGRRALDGGRAAMWMTVLCLLALHVRMGAHFSAPGGTFSPGARANLLATSETVDAMRNLDPAARAIGVGNTINSGYRAVLGVEGDDGPDPLTNCYVRALVVAADLAALDPAWRNRTDVDSLIKARAMHDMMNCRWYVATGAAGQGLGLPQVLEGDLSVYESPTAWPRAFFCDRAITYATEEQLVKLVDGAEGPFAATQVEGAAPAVLGRGTVVAARDYRLTPNTTSFAVKAPGPGVIVLTEAFLPEDFVATVNGKVVPYFRVNGAFKGVEVAAAGEYRVSFAYWPRGLGWMLAAAGTGVGLCAAWLVAAMVRRG